MINKNIYGKKVDPVTQEKREALMNFLKTLSKGELVPTKVYVSNDFINGNKVIGRIDIECDYFDESGEMVDIINIYKKYTLEKFLNNKYRDDLDMFMKILGFENVNTPRIVLNYDYGDLGNEE
jgi:hypothetical protein